MTTHGKIWRLAKENKFLQRLFSEQLGISDIVAQILINRGITNVEDAHAFFNADLKDLHDPMLFKDMAKAVDRILQAIDKGESILIYGDYDVDGITSTSVLYSFLKVLKGEVDYYIPDRSEEGYGLNKNALQRAKEQGFSLVITVDCGISAVEEVKYASELGIDIVITDHHEVPEEIPAAVAIIDPKQENCPYPFKELAGVGIAWKLGQALYLAKGVPFNPGETFVDLVSLGTIADIVPLRGENRIIVKHGLKRVTNTDNIGLKALIEASGLTGQELTTYHVGYGLAPRLNATGRIGSAIDGVKLLLNNNYEESRKVAVNLNKENEKRKAIEAVILEEAQAMVEDNYDLQRQRVIVLASEKWHPGVIGIVASRLVEKYHRPTILICLEGEEGKGSARSIPGFNLYEALTHCSQYLTRYGGHKQAAGLSLKGEHVDVLREAINDYAQQNIQEEHLLPQVNLDAEIALHEVNQQLISDLNRLSPFGHKNPGPVLVCRSASVRDCREVGSGGNHLKLRVSGRNMVLDTIGFQLGHWSERLQTNEIIDLAFVPELNSWQGRNSIQLNLKDIKYTNHLDNPYEIKDSSEKTFVDRLFDNAAQFLVNDYYRNISLQDEFYTKVVGVTFDNRQQLISLLQEGQELKLTREPQNKFDPYAIKVEMETGEQVGYLNADMAKYLAPLLDSDKQYKALVTNVTGGGDRNFGLNIILQKVSTIEKDALMTKMAAERERLSNLSDQELLEAIRGTLLGSYPYHDKQLATIDSLIGGTNTLAVFGTGRGKSAVFQTVAALKAIRENKMTVIIYPLRALVNDQFEAMQQKFEPLGLRVYRANGSISTLERAELFNALETGTADILLTTPEFIEYHMERFIKEPGKIGLFVVDESHHISLASNSHRPAYKRLNKIQQQLHSPLTLAVTATADNEVADEIINTLQIRKVIVDPHIRSNLKLVDKRDCTNKNEYIKDVVSAGDKTIIYVNSRAKTIELAMFLREALPQLKDQIIFYNAGLSSEQRNQIEKMFRDNEVKIVVSTSAFGEGIDIPDIRNVILYHLNFNFTEFNQQSGRAGRNGDTAHIHLVFGKRDVAINKFIMESTAPGRELLGKLYIVLKQLAEKKNPIDLTNAEIAELLNKAGIKEANDKTVSTSLGIFAELKLIEREREGRTRYIHFAPPPGDKIKLEDSLRFAEGLEEKRAFEEFGQFLFGTTDEALLNLINRPIIPDKYLKREAAL